MVDQFQPYLRCTKCGTSRPADMLQQGVCRDDFCSRAKEVLEAAKRHVCWWLRHHPQFANYRDDFFQEASAAAWVSATQYDSRCGATFHTFAFARMKTAVRSFLALQGHNHRRLGERTVQLHAVPEPATPSDCAERPTLLREALELAEGPFLLRGADPRAARVLAVLSTGSTLEMAGRCAGVTRQRAHQIARRWRAEASQAR